MKTAQIKSLASLALFSLGAFAASKTAFADNSTDTATGVDSLYDEIVHFLDQTTIDGDIRSYYFSRNFHEVPSEFNDPSQAAYSLGGNIRILTAPVLGGFQAGAALYTAQDLGLNSDNPKHVDPTLPGDNITVLGQLYLQYKRGDFLIRGGDQLINTPWMGPSDSRMIPATYRGVYGTFTPNPDLTISALRIWEFKSRVADGFSATNLYNPANFGQGIKALGDTTDDGAQALGVNYKTERVAAQLWGYQFFDFGKLLYGDAQYTFINHSKINPLFGVQGLTEGGDGDNILGQVADGSANSNALGAIAGIEAPIGRFTIAWNKVFSEDGAFHNGDIVSPYTAGYASDPLYTTSMIAGLVEKAPGDAFKIMGTVFAFDKKLTLSASYAKYYTEPFFVNTAETDFDVTYAFKSKPLKGLSLRERLGIQTGDPSKGTFYYNRLMLQYSF
ncbi:MAG TPA: OprD family outer membrane porin [Gammaproteobacteria bacterium]|nr:OprD family outer membrane porin [Gammaproteobacteria bacterium]